MHSPLQHSRRFGEENWRAVTLINRCVWQYERVEVENAQSQRQQDECVVSPGCVALSLHSCLASPGAGSRMRRHTEGLLMLARHDLILGTEEALTCNPPPERDAF